MLITNPPGDPELEEVLRKVRLTEADRRRLYEPLRPYSVDKWMSAGPPGTPEEIAEMEELLRLRDEEREAVLLASSYRLS